MAGLQVLPPDHQRLPVRVVDQLDLLSDEDLSELGADRQVSQRVGLHAVDRVGL